MNWTEKYIGLHFKDHGRDFDGVDCWGLVQLIMREEQDIELPSYGETSALDLQKVAGMIAKESSVDPWVHVLPQTAKPFDVVVMHRRRDPIHVGIMVSDKEIMHVEEKISAVIVPLTHHTICFRTPRFFRHVEMVRRAS